MIPHILALAISLPIQLGLVSLNHTRNFFTVGELRFWSIAVFVIVEIAYLAAF